MNRKIILLVDDDCDDAEFFKWAMAGTEETFAIEFVDSGDAALQLLSELKSLPDLILLDAGMPKMDGWELLKIIKQEQRFAKVPVIMMATSSRMKGIDEAQFLGAHAYIVKPSDFNELKLIMHELCIGVQNDLTGTLQKMHSNLPKNIFTFS
ncbi:response regulator [Flavobacterium johnsoniae]|jgi:CheY-like chemotaxis protein|uniref:Response regulator receiver domain-containing protein n=1 Tax=Flavobacterium johnsoniae TaxID=986 RepID=A0A1M5V7T3_FLAJO|nr:response regulator [Flavobacterium johnsoniae]SHH71275.1 Response regulator receiver domain-containing protein [Flavobacterium johnsoniae]